ncbi:DUF397 domain-containing protein [Saccharomonospora saliphila]|uniref:DUF397 domain-containing protein n=1 Tax=Saccharomonospora saliphila TaxID=369829 RepID=UPI0003678D94|nr:DUF397 domain-containing protein [Saccharomonospora saliphila]
MIEENPAVDDKSGVRDRLDLRSARWRRLRPATGTVEFAFVTDGDTTTYVALRRVCDPEGTVLVFTPSEWDAFLAGARDGEFDLPEAL